MYKDVHFDIAALTPLSSDQSSIQHAAYPFLPANPCDSYVLHSRPFADFVSRYIS